MSVPVPHTPGVRVLVVTTLLALAPLLPLGCSALVDFHGLADGVGDAGGGDAPMDSGADIADGNGEHDATQSPVDSGDAGAPFCPQSGAVLCDDFDLGVNRSIPGPWDKSRMGASGTLAVQDLLFASGPSALLLKTDDTTFSVGLTKHLTAVKGATVAMDVFIQTRGQNLYLISFEGSGISVGLAAANDTYSGIGEGAGLPDGGYFFDEESGAPVPTGAWVHVAYDIDLPKNVVTATIGNHPSFQKPLVLSSWSGALDAYLGAPDTEAATLFYDNVVITTR